MHLGKKASSYRGAYRVPLINLSVGMCVCVCVIFVVFPDCESCTRPISTNPGSMEAGENRRTRGTRLLAYRLEVVAIAGLLWTSWCVLGAAGLRFFPFFFSFFSSNALKVTIKTNLLAALKHKNAHGLLQKHEADLHNLPRLLVG